MNVPARALSSPLLSLHSREASQHHELSLLDGPDDDQWMLRAGAAAAQLARAIAPHARQIAIACGSGHNGGDGYAMAAQLAKDLRGIGCQVLTMDVGDSLPKPATRRMKAQALAAGATPITTWPTAPDLVVDAVLGLGAQGAPRSPVISILRQLLGAPICLCIDQPSGLDINTGEWLCPEAAEWTALAQQNRHTLCFLTAKPGLFTGAGRDWAGEVWVAKLGASDPRLQPDAVLWNQSLKQHARPHQSHKGTRGDVFVVAGQSPDQGHPGMLGAGVLAARAALHGGAGRVTWVPMGQGTPAIDWVQPDIMVRDSQQWLGSAVPESSVWVMGCGAGASIEPFLARALDHAGPLVLDADALNHMALLPKSTQHQWRIRASAKQHTQVMTPHPLEAARLLNTSTREVQANRLHAAQQLAQDWHAVVVLKGSGTVIAAPGMPALINASGNAQLGVAGTGDVLAGLIGAHLAQSNAGARQDLHGVQQLVASAVWEHGRAADLWPQNHRLSASELTRAIASM